MITIQQSAAEILCLMKLRFTRAQYALSKKVLARPLEELLKIVGKMMGTMGMADVRASLLRDRGLPSDVRDVLEWGKLQGGKPKSISQVAKP